MRFLPSQIVFTAALLAGTPSWAADVWNEPAFSASPEALRQAAALIKADKGAEVTILLNEDRFVFDGEGKVAETFRSIYRIENEEGVKGWAETSSRWEPWHESKPEIRARVITADGAVHPLDGKTLTDLPVHEDSPDTFSDERAYGGPLPAIAVGAIVEEEIITRDTAPFFAAGQVTRLGLTRSVPVNKTRVAVSHPISLPFHYVVRRIPEDKLRKNSTNGIETIEIEDGPYAPNPQEATHVPPDAIPGPQVAFSTGTSWGDVAAEYARLSSEKLRAADVQPLLVKVKLQSPGRQELIRRLVAALHKTVRYTGVEFGESSLVPQYPAETLKRKYGDCKDKATLLVTMLRAAGIRADLALLDTGPGQDIESELPGLGMFDHAIVFVPASASDPEMWIDATAQYIEPGYLPMMDYGRWALIVDPATTQLKKIPEITSAQNLHRETREFTMADYGLAKIVETNEEIGPREQDLRDFYTGDAKKVRENGEKYVKDMYLADSLVSIDHGDLTDMAKPFKVSYVTKGRRGFTYLTNANMAIRQETIFDGLPSYFYEKEVPTKAGDDSQPKPRTVDWWIPPFATEWHYKITAPPGFKLRSLPADKDQQMASAHYSQKYTANPEGTLAEAVFRFDSGQQRLTAEQAKVLRDEIVKARQADPIFITFDEVGFSLLSAGKVKEGLASEQKMAALHPKQALYRVRLAEALLQVGMGEQARVVAKQATVLDPASAQAFSTLGWALEHDLIGRRLQKGFDYSGAVAAYRRAKQLDPKDKEIRSNLGYLLEFDAAGIRYGSAAHLEEAAAEFKELKKVDEEEGQKFEDNVLYDLWYARKSKDVATYAEGLPATNTRKAFILAALAAEQGGDSANRKSMALTTEEAERSKALVDAGSLLMRVQKYREAVEVLKTAQSQPGGSKLSTLIGMLEKTRPQVELNIDSKEPSSVVQRLFSEIFSNNPDPERIRKQLVSRNVPPSRDAKKEALEFRQSMFDLRRQLGASGLPLQVVRDLVLSNAKYTKEGDETLGYHIVMQPPAAEAIHGFVSREDGEYRAVEISLSGSKPPSDMGWEILARLDRKDLPGARQWLDWARERVHMTAGDDPLAGELFPHFWTKGQSGDEATARIAALVLLPSKELRREHLSALVDARDRAPGDAARNLLNLALAEAYAAQEKWAELFTVSEQLMKAVPDSFIAFAFAAASWSHLGRFDDWDKVLRSRLEKHPGEAQYVRSAASLALYRGDVAGARKLLKDLIENGKAAAGDLNSYSWDALMLPNGVDQDAVDAAQRANDLSKNGSFAILHTLACLYADIGKTTQAREVIVKAMDAGKLEEPDSAVWFALGKIAEQYGQIEAAKSMYARVEKPTTEEPASSYALAQMRLQALHGN